jgi:hypothetical protein
LPRFPAERRGVGREDAQSAQPVERALQASYRKALALAARAFLLGLFSTPYVRI